MHPLHVFLRRTQQKMALSELCCCFLNRWNELGNWHTMQAHLAVHSWVSALGTSCLTLYTPATFTALSFYCASICFKLYPFCLATFYLSPARLNSVVTSSRKPYGHDLLTCPLMLTDHALLLEPKGTIVPDMISVLIEYIFWSLSGY